MQWSRRACLGRACTGVWSSARRPLLERVGEDGREVLGDLERVDGDVERRHALGRARRLRDRVRRRELLERDVVVVLHTEVRR